MPCELFKRVKMLQFSRQRIPDPWPSSSSKTPIASS